MLLLELWVLLVCEVLVYYCNVEVCGFDMLLVYFVCFM